MILRSITSDIEMRDGEDKDHVTLSGYALKWGDTSQRGAKIFETFAKGAFPAEVRQATKYLALHKSLPLASVKSGTLEIREDEVGLLVEPTLDLRDSDSANLVRKVERGDLDSQSIGFSRFGNKIKVSRRDDGSLLVTVNRIKKLAEVSAVSVPAYHSSTLAARDYEIYSAVEEFEKRDAHSKELFDFNNEQIRLSLLLN